MSVELEAPTMWPLTLGLRLLEGLVVAVESACGTKYELLWRVFRIWWFVFFTPLVSTIFPILVSHNADQSRHGILQVLIPSSLNPQVLDAFQCERSCIYGSPACSLEARKYTK